MSSKPKTTTAKPAEPDFAAPASYEAALAELDALVAQLESGQMPLGQLLGGYQRGASLLAYCRAQLQAVEAQVLVMDGEEFKPLRTAQP